MKLELPTGETHTLERKRGPEGFKLEVAFREDGDAYSLDYRLNRLVDQTTLDRSDITNDLVERAIDEFFAKIEDSNVDVDEVISIEIVSEQALRKTPYDDRDWDEE